MTGKETLPGYVLVTPARNEARFIERTLRSVVAQTVLPIRWAIVSDGSTDGTDRIVGSYADAHPWIELVRLPERRERHFAGKVHAFNAGYDAVRHLPYDVIGNIDADISFDETFLATLLARLAADPKLGLVGAPFRESASNDTYDYRFVSIEHVSGCCQLFRRECFEQIGGYKPVKAGGIDHIAVITSRMMGWKTRTFPEISCMHHRDIGSAQDGVLSSRFKYGGKDYSLGGHPLWELFRSAYQMTKQPYVLGGLALFSGYLWSMARRAERPVSPELMAFHRGEQMQRLRNFLSGRLPRRD